jgi:hypothetical protein
LESVQHSSEIQTERVENARGLGDFGVEKRVEVEK